MEETLTGYLSLSSASSWRKPALPTKPCRDTFALVDKAYTVAGQAGASLYPMVVLQAYQADLLKELDYGKGLAQRQLKSFAGPQIWARVPPTPSKRKGTRKHAQAQSSRGRQDLRSVISSRMAKKKS